VLFVVVAMIPDAPSTSPTLGVTTLALRYCNCDAPLDCVL